MPSGSNKKPRLSRNSVLESLEPGAFAIVASFISPRDLLCLSMCSKRYRYSQCIRHDHVVTSALLAGGQAKRTATQVIEMALPSTGNDKTSGSIHLPTPIRLLRLINGTRCESPGCSAAMTTVRPHFGLFLCWDCFLGVTTVIDLKHEVIVNEKRIARFENRRNAHVLTSPFIDTSGERAGPIVSWDAVSGAGFEELLKAADNVWGPETETYKSIMKCFSDDEVRGASRHQVCRPVANAVLLMKRLKDMLEVMQCPYADVLCSFQERRQLSPDGSGLYLSCVVFDANIVDELVSPLITSQNQATERQLEEIADDLGQAMQTLNETGFLDFSFLNEDNPWENGLLQHFRQQTQPDFALRSVNGDMLEEIRQGDLFGAMQWLENNYSVTPPNDPDRPTGNWARVFADVVLVQNASIISQYPLITATCARDLAKITYIDVVAERSPTFAETVDEDDEEEDERVEFTKRCNVAAIAFQQLLPPTQTLLELINTEASRAARIDPRARQAYVNSITAQLGKLRGDVVTRFRNRDFVSILSELCRNRGRL
ncbi:hypothetical protein MHU86_4248 [Fragilaria crotonensis]|nr:hypothetical protein MHU86_4248 [Fragilaria crotonensis]